MRDALLASTALVATALLPDAIHAQDATWLNTPVLPFFNDFANWDTGVVPTGTAFFGQSSGTFLFMTAPSTSIGSWTFNSGASDYTFVSNQSLIFTGPGIVINGGSATIANTGTLEFFGTSTAGSATTINNNNGILSFFNTSTAGSALINVNFTGSLNFNGNSTAANATINVNNTVYFNDNSTAANATINNNSILSFNGNSTAANATISNSSILNFFDTSTAGSATITNNSGASVFFFHNSTGGNAAITNIGGALVDFSSSTGPAGDNRLSVGSLAGAGSFQLGANELTVGSNNLATEVSGVISGLGGSLIKVGSGALTLSGANTYTGGTRIDGGLLQIGTAAQTGTILGTVIVNNFAGVDFVNANTSGITGILNGGAVQFLNSTSASSAAITNNNNLNFFDTSTAGNATITNNATLQFLNNSAAGSAAITNNNNLNFFETSTAGNATINNNATLQFLNNSAAGSATISNNSILNFFDTSTAANATINNNGGTLSFRDTSTAGSAIINVNAGGSLNFNDTSTAANATITTDAAGATRFFDSSTGGNARFITNTAGTFDMSTLAAAGMTAGSIEGAGSYILGAKALTVGSNNLSTEVSGVISGLGGSLIKVGTGTLTLLGANTYSGGTTISGGAIEVGNNNAVGTGTVTLDGGTFRAGFNTLVVTNPFSINASGGNVDTNGNLELALTGSISGPGALTKIGAGTLVLDGNNTYSGGTFLQQGTLALAHDNALGTGPLTTLGSGGVAYASGVTINNPIILNSNDTELNVRLGIATQAGNISELNGPRSLEKTGTGTLVLTGANTYTGSTSVNQGTLQAGAANTLSPASALNVAAGATLALNNFNQTVGSLAGAGSVTLGSATLTAGGNNTSTTFSGIIGGSGGLTKVGTGTLILSGANTYTGATNVNAGVLSVNGSPVSTVNVNNGSTLMGTGMVGGLNVINGTLAPGNSIGTITVNGNLMMTAASTYQVEVSPAAADRTNVTGTATLGGATVSAIYAAGSYVSKRYTILNAAGGVSGTFNTLVNTNLPANFTPSLNYDPKNAYLDLTLKFTPPSPPTSPNSGNGLSGSQNSVASALINSFNTAGGIPLVFGLLTPQGLTQLSGEAATGAALSATQMMNAFLSLTLNPYGGSPTGNPGALGYARALGANEAALPKAAADAYAADMPVKAAPPASIAVSGGAWSVWGQGYGGYNKTDGNLVVGSNDTTARTYGFAAGADHRVSPATTVGFALAGGELNWSLSRGLGSGKSDVFQAGVYGSHRIGAAYVSAALAYAWYDMSTDRTVTAVGNDLLRASFDAHNIGGRLEGGYRFAMSSWGGVTPYGAVQVQRFRTPNYSEVAGFGNNTFALSYNSNSTTASRFELGSWFDHLFAFNNGNAIMLRGRLAWAHDDGNNGAISSVFQTLPGAGFTVNGATPPQNLALASVGAELRLVNNVSLGARFDGEFSDRAQTYSGTGTVRYRW